nr:hypothetical protein [Kofleriaceae bacterium]
MSAITGCNYGVTFDDCQVRCTGSGDCPDSFSCQSGMCRAPGETGACSAPGTVTLRQTTDDTIDRNVVLGCTNSDQTTAAQSWFRVFSPADAGIGGALQVDKVNLGICIAVGMTTVSVTVGVYGGGIGEATLDKSMVSGTTQVTAQVPETQLTELVAIPITATIPTGKNVFVEIDAPDLIGTGGQIDIGSTDSAQTHPAYIEAPRCGTTVPTSTTKAMLSNAAFVITVEGSG